jgi:hypothetical protein
MDDAAIQDWPAPLGSFDLEDLCPERPSSSLFSYLNALDPNLPVSQAPLSTCASSANHQSNHDLNHNVTLPQASDEAGYTNGVDNVSGTKTKRAVGEKAVEMPYSDVLRLQKVRDKNRKAQARFRERKRV